MVKFFLTAQKQESQEEKLPEKTDQLVYSRQVGKMAFKSTEKNSPKCVAELCGNIRKLDSENRGLGPIA